jgi:transposase
VSSSSTCVCLSCPAHKELLCGVVKRYPSSSVTDEQWAVLEPLLPAPGNTRGRGGRSEKWPRRLVLDAIFYVVRGGIAWRQLPAGFPPPDTVYGFFARWARNGVWQRVHDALRDQVRVSFGKSPLPTAAVIDSQSVQGSDQVHRDSRGYDAGKKTNGRKRHIAVDTNGLLLTVVVTVASLQDRDGAFRILARLGENFSTIGHVWADAGYTGRFVTWAKKTLAITVEILKRSDDLTGFHVLPRRWVVERTFAWITKHRRLNRDYETRPDHHEALIHTALIMTMSRRLSRP